MDHLSSKLTSSVRHILQGDVFDSFVDLSIEVQVKLSVVSWWWC